MAQDLARFTAYYFQRGGLTEAAYVDSLRPFNPAPAYAWGFHIPDGAEIAWTLADHTCRGVVGL